jgi:DNA recombination protein RmuC
MDGITFLAGIVSGAIAGGAVESLWLKQKCRAEAANAQTKLALAEQRAGELSMQCAAANAQIDLLRQQVSQSDISLAAADARLESAQQNILEQKQLLEESHHQLKDAFARVSAEALAKNNEAFLSLARERFATLSKEASGTLDERKAQIEGLLKPMQELLGQYQLRLNDVEKSRVESYSMLREQLGVLSETQRTLNTQTGALVSALRRPNTRGQWGEVTLKRLVELAGMSNRCDFFEQTSHDTVDGKIRPDMVVRLPGQREVVIDCKASLDAFLDAVAAADEDNRKVCLQRHAQQVRSRARELAAKSYWSQFQRAPEFVVMFLPGEAFFAAAVETEPALYEECLKNRVIVATPTTLLALLRSIEYGWKQADMTENAEMIRQLGQELYDRVFTLTTYFTKLGASIEGAVSHYNSAIGSLESRVMVTARKMGELGARTEKEIPEIEPIEKAVRELPATLSET